MTCEKTNSISAIKLLKRLTKNECSRDMPVLQVLCGDNFDLWKDII